MWQHWDPRIQNMWVRNGALLCFLLSVFLMKIPESNAKLTDNLWMSDGNSSDVCKINPSNRVGCGSAGISKSKCQSKGCCFDDSTPNAEWCFQKQACSSMVEAIKERLENIPPKRDNTSELSMTLLKLDDLIRINDSCLAQHYNILEDLFLKIVENPSLDDHFPDFASSFAMAILPTAIQSKNEDSPLLKSKLETPFPDPVDDSADPHEEIVTINGNYDNCVLKDKPGMACSGDKIVSTGLYAKQGQLIKVTVPSNAVGKFHIQINVHSLTPFEYNQNQWLEGNNHIRPCCITQFYPSELIKEETKLLSAYGGIIYIINMPNITSQIGNFTLKFDKVITSPTFIEGKTTNEQWYKMLASSKSPMTELEVPGLIVTIPKLQYENAHYNMERLSSRLAQLMQAVLDMAGYLPPSGHRYVYDLLPIGAQSGYPAWDGEVFNYTRELLQLANDTDENFSNVWAMIHELGCTQGKGEWTPKGMSEVTCNIFPQYANEVVLNVSRQLPNFEYVEDFKRNGRNFSTWNNLAGRLNIFMFVKEECSWNTFKKFFKYYNEEIDESMLPILLSFQNDTVSYSLIARVLSEKCNKNLFPFFKWWNWPIFSDDEEATKNLPEWKGIIDRLERSTKNGPDYLKEKDTGFTGTDIGSKKADGEEDWANIE